MAMTMTMASALDAVNMLIKQRRIRSAIDTLRELHDGTLQPESQALTAFQCAVVYWSEAGDGESARAMFNAACRLCNSPQLSQSTPAQRIRANCCENMMLLSLSETEYQLWVDELTKLQPQNPILRDHPPKFRKWLDEGKPWVDVMQSLAATFYNRNDPARDRGLYGCAASLWQLVLKNRKSLRLTRDDWRTAVYEHAVLAMRMAQHAGQEMERQTRMPARIHEFIFIAEAAEPFVEEFLAANPSDPMILELWRKLQSFLTTLRRAPNPPVGCFVVTVLLCTGIGWVVGLVKQRPYAWLSGIYAGLIIGGIWWVIAWIQGRQQRS